MRHRIISTVVVGLACALGVGCSYADKDTNGHGDHHGHGHGDQPMAHKHEKMFSGIHEAVAVLHPTEGHNASGGAGFVETNGKLTVTAEVSGLEANQKHAIHVHEFGDCSAPDASSAGSHYNPEGHAHGLPNGTRHAGDLGNLEADGDGHATFKLVVANLTLAGMKNPVLGRAVIVHAKPDDGGQPVGNAGGRIACGVIGVAKK